jgi:hypothetical protein
MLPAFAAALVGCSRNEGGGLKQEMSHVRLLTSLYSRATSKLGHVPRDQQEFKQAIAILAVKPEKMKVNSIDELFVSERDGQPLVVVYGTLPKASDVVVYEQTGVDGKRQVGHRIGMVEELDEAGYNDLMKALKR